MKNKLSKRKMISMLLAFAMIFTIVAPAKQYAVNAAGGSGTSKILTSGLKVNYAVIEEASMSISNEKKYAVIDIGDGTTKIKKAVLEVVNQTTGKSYTFDSDTIMDSSILFYLGFPNNNQAGDYKIKNVKYQANGKEYLLDMTASKIAPKFSVGKDFEEQPSGWLVDEETSKSFETAETSDTAGQEFGAGIEGAVDLSDSFEHANVIGVDANNSGAFIKSESDKAVRSIQEKLENISGNATGSKSGNIIIVLDPGHGYLDPGAGRVWAGKTYSEHIINQKIANACKAQLEKDSRITVYMTRNSATEKDHEKDYPDGGDIGWRCKFAKDKDADLFVSLHNNIAASSAAQGTEVYIPNANYNVPCYKVSQTVGKSILNKLVALGLTGRGLFIRNTENGTRYPDGSYSDYYGVIRRCKLYGIPAMIVEHCFLSNQSDCERFLGSDASIAAVGIADANGILENVAYLQKNRANSKYVGWQTIDGHKMYYDQNENPLKGWFTVDGAKYYADSNGYVLKGWQFIDNKWYYFTKSYKLKTGGGWLTIKNVKHYLLADGSAASGWLEVNGKKYFFGKRGVIASGWATYGKKTYYFDSKNRPVKGWQVIDDATYYFKKKNGLMKKNSWLTENGKKYYFLSNGKMATGMRVIDGKRYYFTKKGTLKTGWLKFKKNRYYLDDATGAAYTNRWLSSTTGNWYYFNKKGKAVKGFKTIEGKRYYFSDKGVLLTGWITVDNNRYFGDKDTGLYKNYWYTNKKGSYYFKSDYKMATGFNLIGGKTYYFDDNGLLVKESREINGVFYYIDENGVVSKRPLTPIMGTATKTVAQMVANYKSSGMKYPTKALKKGGATDIETFCQIIYEEASSEGVRPEVLYSQVMLETGWLQFGGDVKVTQFNFGGLGATGGGVGGATFKSVRLGLRAQTQHLKAYASKESLKNKLVDGRFKFVERGCAVYVEHLGQKENPKGKGWAVAKDYGYKILNVMDSIK